VLQLLISKTSGNKNLQKLHTINTVNQDAADRKVKSETIIGDIVGALIATVTGGILWGLQIMGSGRMFAIFFCWTDYAVLWNYPTFYKAIT